MSKKLIALTLTAALTLSSIVPAFAEESISANAQAAKDLGMLKGANSAGVTVEYTKTAPTRLQAAILFLRLKGLESAALSYTGIDNFADTKDVAWAEGKNVMAYLKAHPELGWAGIGNDKFNPNAQVDAKSYYKVMLEALGYKQNTADVIGDFTWDNIVAFAASKGLDDVMSVANFTVDNVATATIEAMKAAIKGSTKTLAASLVEAKIISEEAAIKAGVYTKAPVALAVESVKTDNLKQLVVKFNKEIKEAGDQDNYKLEADNAVLDSSSKFTLLDDKKTVVITLTTEAAQQESVQLTIKGIEAVDGSKIPETVVKDIELFDKTIPSATKAQVIGSDTIKVTFSEPIKTVSASDFKVDNGEVIVKGITMANNNTEVNVELYSTLNTGTVTIEVGTGVKDFAGFAGPKNSFTLNVVEDEAAPVVVGYKDATPTGVTLIFNEDIKLVSDPTPASDFYHTNTSNTVDAAVTAANIDGKELKLNFTTNKMPEGTAYVYMAKDIVSDLWGNKNAKVAQTVQVTLDTTKPVVEKVEVTNEDEMVLTFSEDIDATTAQDETNYTLLDKDGNDISSKIQTATLTDTDEVTIAFTEDLNGNYSMVVDKVEDLAGNAIAKVTKAFTVNDVTAPLFTNFTAKLYKAGTTGQMLKINFKEAMAVTGKYSVLDLEKYELGGQNLADIKNVTIKAVDGNKAVEISIPSNESTDGVDFADTDNLVIARVADAAGNFTAALASGNIDVLPVGTVNIDVTDAKVQPMLTAKDTVVVTLSDRLTKFNASDFVIKEATTNTVQQVSRVKHTINEDGMSVITFTLETAINTNGTTAAGNAINVTTIASPTSENVYGEKLAGSFSRAINDKAAPTVTKVDFIDATTIKVYFSEDLNAATFATGKNGFSVAGGTLTSAAQSDTNEVTLTGSNFTINTNVYYNALVGIKDVNGNTLADLSRTDVLTRP